MNKLNRMEASTIFKARTRMIEVKNNYKNKYKDKKCRLCKNQEEDQTHVLQECEGLQERGLARVTKEEIFSEDVKTLKEAVPKINAIILAINSPIQNP